MLGTGPTDLGRCRVAPTWLWWRVLDSESQSLQNPGKGSLGCSVLPSYLPRPLNTPILRSRPGFQATLALALRVWRCCVASWPCAKTIPRGSLLGAFPQCRRSPCHLAVTHTGSAPPAATISVCFFFNHPCSCWFDATPGGARGSPLNLCSRSLLVGSGDFMWRWEGDQVSLVQNPDLPAVSALSSPVCLLDCLPVCLSVSVCLSACLSVCLSACLSVYLPIYL